MSRYTFTSLSAQDFEEFVRDLLQAEWNVAIEAFKTGRDSGIDLRCAPAHDGATIVQCKHYAVAELAVQASERLAASWYHEFPEFRSATRLLQKIGENTWFLSHGGQEAYRTLVDSMLNELNRATASDWLAMIEFPNNALDWTEGDEDHFSRMLKAYCELGVDDEISDCTTLDEMSELKDSLEELVKKYGLGLEGAIYKLEEEIAEREEGHDYDDERSFGGGRPIRHQEVMSDEDVSQMFSTLRDSSPS
jgi:hypothetical protein